MAEQAHRKLRRLRINYCHAFETQIRYVANNSCPNCFYIQLSIIPMSLFINENHIFFYLFFKLSG